MSTPQTFIQTDRACDQCEYNLKGLPTDGNCPECGAPIRRRPTRTSGTMSQEAPTSFVSKLYLGFSLASLGIFCTLILPMIIRIFGAMGFDGPLVTYSGRLLWFLSPLFWIVGIWIITEIRPNRESIVRDKTLDNDKFRLIVRLVSIAWPLYLYSSFAHSALAQTANPSGALMIPLAIVALITGIVAWIGLIPTSVYFAEMGYWASHDHLAQRLRGTAWAMTTFGVLTALLAAIGMTGGSLAGAASFVSFFTILALVVAVVVFLFTVFQLGSVMRWVANHQQLAAGSADRVRERVERDINTSGVITTGLKCRVCKYDLNGSPFGGCCPECGESYADFTPLPILDPAKMHTDRDESEINIEEGQNKGIYFNQELDASGKPKASGVAFTPEISDIPDEGDIPLFDSTIDEAELTEHDPKNTPPNAP